MNGKMIGNELIYRPNIIYFESFQKQVSEAGKCCVGLIFI